MVCFLGIWFIVWFGLRLVFGMLAVFLLWFLNGYFAGLWFLFGCCFAVLVLFRLSVLLVCLFWWLVCWILWLFCLFVLVWFCVCILWVCYVVFVGGLPLWCLWCCFGFWLDWWCCCFDCYALWFCYFWFSGCVYVGLLLLVGLLVGCLWACWLLGFIWLQVFTFAVFGFGFACWVLSMWLLWFSYLCVCVLSEFVCLWLFCFW